MSASLPANCHDGGHNQTRLPGSRQSDLESQSPAEEHAVTKFLCLCGCLLLAATSLPAQDATTTRPAPTGAPAAKSSELGAETEPIRQALQAYVGAFNKHDAKAIAALWMPRGVYTDRSTGERVEGRDALEKDFAATFKEKPSVQLTATLERVRFIRPDVASAEGTAVESAKGDEGRGNKTAFSAIFVRQDAQWLFDSIQESDVQPAQAQPVALTDLEWLVGHWVDKSDQARVDTVCRWSARRAFLVRSFTIKSGADGEPDQGTEIIAWDPKTKQIRSWTFLSDGAFGDATWTKEGKDWKREGRQTLNDGRTASGTQVISRVDDNTTTVELIAKEIDGEPQPATDPLTVVRVPDDKAAPPESSSSTPNDKKEERQ
jgi:uncharacterized protein (TIGR02246 family)